MPYVRTVKTGSGATAVQIVYSSHRGSREIEHIGSAHDEVELELLKAVARQRLAAGQGELDLGLAVGTPGGPLPITASRMAHLWDALLHGYRVLGFERAVGGDEVFAQLVLARIIEPTSKLDSARVLEEAGVEAFPARNLDTRTMAGSWSSVRLLLIGPQAVVIALGRLVAGAGTRFEFLHVINASHRWRRSVLAWVGRGLAPARELNPHGRGQSGAQVRGQRARTAEYFFRLAQRVFRRAEQSAGDRRVGAGGRHHGVIEDQEHH